MPNRPQAAYQVIDSTELDDLVIWSNQNHSVQFVSSPALREELHRLLGEDTTTTYFAGPLEGQFVFDPAGAPPPALPIVVRFQLGLDGPNIAFLYLNESTTELHIPERFFTTGRADEDARRFAAVRKMLHGLSALFGQEWQLAEYGGNTTNIENFDEFWEAYSDNVFDRIDYETCEE